MFVREADLAYDLGPASARPYLDHAVLERALCETGADAAWVGWGFVAEDPAFAELCERIGVTFVGPSPEAMRRLGDKIGSKLIAEEVGVPVAPWSRGGVDTLEDATRRRPPHRLPADAQGHRGRRRARHPRGHLRRRPADAYERTRDEAQAGLRSGVVFLEALVTGARHVEVQVIADGQGTAWALGVRDCSVQRRNQKVIEESASPVLDVAQTGELKASAERLAIAVGYAGAGTVEFLYHPGDRFFAFLEVNTRLQVEHPDHRGRHEHRPRAAADPRRGRRPARRDTAPTRSGHAVEARLNAEDPDRDFAPAPGRIDQLELPAGPGIRVDTGVAEGDSIPADFDSMIAKIIAHGRDRDEALARLRRALRETTVVIDGGSTNKTFILDLLDQPEVIDGTADTGWIDRVRAEGRLVATRALRRRPRRRRHRGATRTPRPSSAPASSRPRVAAARRCSTTWAARSTSSCAARPTRSSSPHRSDALPGRRSQSRPARTVTRRRRPRADRRPREPGHRRGPHPPPRHATHGPVQLVEVDGVTHRVSRDEGGVAAFSRTGPRRGDPGEGRGRGRRGRARARARVDEDGDRAAGAVRGAGARSCSWRSGARSRPAPPSLRLEPTGRRRRGRRDGRRGPRPRPARRRRRTATSPSGRPAARADLSAMLLGYDLDPGHETRTLAGYLAARDELGGVRRAHRSPTRWTCSASFADFAELSRNRPVGEEAHIENRVHSPREHFHTYLQTLDPERGALPADFVGRLERVLRPLRRHRRRAHRRRSRGRSSGSSSPSSARPPRSSMATSILQRWLVEPAPGRSSEARRPRAARPARVGHPAALPHRRRPRAQRAVPLVRPAARRRRPGLACSGRWATSSSRSTPCPSGDRAHRARRRAGRHPRADRPLPR